MEFPPVISPPTPITGPKATSTIDSSFAMGSSSAELKALAKQLLAQASQLDSQSGAQSHSSEGSCSPGHDPYSSALFQDAQDPFEANS